jgi:hypothetical protein
MKPVRETIKETLQLASAGELERALVLLDRAVRDAITEGESVATPRTTRGSPRRASG